jgi:uncharacterized membrane protein (DUF485 family)
MERIKRCRLSKKLKRKFQKVIAGLSCVMFLQATLFPFMAAAQVMAVPTPIIPQVVLPVTVRMCATEAVW